MASKKPAAKKKPAAIEQKGAWPNWQPMGGYPNYTGDTYGRQTPNANQLINAVEDTVYACVSLISDTVASTQVKLYVKTYPGQARPKVATLPVYGKRLDYIRNTKNIHRDVHIEEVCNHPVLDLLNRCNSYHNRLDLICLTQLFKETTGNAFWLMKFDDYGIPVALFLLPTQHMKAERDENGMVKSWRFGTGLQEKLYSTDEIIHFKMPNMADPYGMGYAPLQAAYNRAQIQFKELGFLDANLSNFGRPDAILAPQESISPFEAERLAKDFLHRFRGQGAGGVFVADGPMQVTPISWPAKDFAELQLYQTIKNSVSNVFHIPPQIWELGDSNRASSEAVLFALAVHCIKPRMLRLVEKLNERLIPHYDERLFFEADSVVPEDKQFDLQEMQMLLATGTVTRNEVRQKYGYEPRDWANEPLLPPGSMPATTFAVQDNQPEPTPEPEEDRSSLVPALSQLQEAVYGGLLPREAAIQTVQICYEFSPEQAASLFPDISPVKLTPDAPMPNQEQEKPMPEQEEVKPKARTKTIKRKSPLPFAAELQRFFRTQKEAILSRAKALEEVQTKGLPENWFDVHEWTESMYQVMRPVVALYYDYSAKQTVTRIGASHDLLKVVQPKLKEAVDKATFLFCSETNKTTSLQINDAVSKLKESFTEGIEQGEIQNQLTKRVGEIFDSAEIERSYRIAITESSRAQNGGQYLAAKESGLVKGKRWLLSDDACPICMEIMKTAPEVGLDENFTIIGEGPYSEIPYPPAHPACRCNWLEVIDI